MTSTKLKGQNKELMCANDLKSCGYKILFKSCTVRRGPCWVGLDFADLFDVVAVNDVRLWRLISCKIHGRHTHGYLAKDMCKIAAWAKQYGLSGMSFELWLWHEARHSGRGKKKHWERAHWEIKLITWVKPQEM